MSETQALQQVTRIAAYAVVVDEQRRMLVVRVTAGYVDAGQWTLPGGGIQFGEAPADAVRRELEEETGFTGEIERLLSVDSWTRGPMPEQGWGAFHGIQIIYAMRITGGALRHEVDESTDMAAWVALDEIRQLPLVPLLDQTVALLDGWNIAVAD